MSSIGFVVPIVGGADVVSKSKLPLCLKIILTIILLGILFLFIQHMKTEDNE